MTQQELDQLIEAIGTGFGDVLAERHAEIAMTCIVAVLAIARQPSIDAAQLVSDMDDLIAGLSPKFQRENASAPSLLSLLRLQIEKQSHQA